MSKWTKLSQMRPPYMEMVIFYDGENVWPGWSESQLTEDFEAICADPGFMNETNDVVCWMLLPPPPEEEWMDKVKMEWTK